MVARLKRPSGKEAAKALKDAGWQSIGRIGSHLVMIKPGVRANLTIPQQRRLSAGTIRKIENAVATSMLPGDLQHTPQETAPESIESEGMLSLDDSEHRAILRALEQCHWVQKDAAQVLGISRRAIHYKIKKYGIGLPGK
jgi:transcriptional regulator with GAF, ATPase, and Fis domain